ncbi:MAG: DUF2520 domain-containing protein [Tannerella sp.]|jgi:predicted short-subunit dehydrogenase-like oxidoreductase (DUF2520 family)|nr:DUF2520 domain-containing protein [Tannerella sp.]
MKIVFIGAGHLATGLSMEMQRVGMTVNQIYSRTKEHAGTLARKLNCSWTNQLHEVTADADLYIFAVPESVLAQILPQIPLNKGLWVHTSGCMPMQVFEGYTNRYGVFFLVQAFSIQRKIALGGTPVFIEANNPKDLSVLQKVAIALSGNAQVISFEKRKHIHLASVFAGRFVNRLYAIAGKILQEQEIPYSVLLPLIIETAAKTEHIAPLEVQAGQGNLDREVMEKLTSMLNNEMMKTVYALLNSPMDENEDGEPIA